MVKSFQSPGGKAEAIADTLRSQIVRGDYHPGGQLLTLDDMQIQFGVTRPTLIRAIDRLKRDGFVRTARSKGTFVTDRPPHLVRFGLAFSSHPQKPLAEIGGWNRFWDMMAKLGPRVAQQMGLDMPVFHNLAGRDSEGEQVLQQQLQLRRLAGLIIVGSRELFQSRPMLDGFQVPMVAIHDDRRQPIDMPKVYVDKDSFFSQAVNTLQSLGRRRVATIHLGDYRGENFINKTPSSRPSPLTHRIESLVSTMQQLGFNSPAHWQLRTGISGAHNLVRTLMDLPADRRPDGLMVCDDNLTEHVVDAVLASGLRVDEDVSVVAHANWPAEPIDTAPVVRLGFDIHELMHTALATLQARCQGRGVPDTQYIKARPDAHANSLSTSAVSQPIPARPDSLNTA